MAVVGSRWLLGLGAFALGCLLTLGIVAAGALMFFWSRQDCGRQEPDPGPSAYSREEFTSLVNGKTEDEVVGVVGKPDAESEDREATYWHYRNRTRDPVTGAIDSDVQVVFEKGRVVALNY